ncbi:MAG: hypothetical protein CVU63_15530 [Deltaproteobacteria bacterium HGW-Deltaproteobacteria-20]|nr:MAG: hypothetical protein CVU63_15530 [Deltaproteobacteria bacterium HGW-Deltaproteobacteria-20]
MKTFALSTSLFALLLAACSSSTEPSDSQSGAAMSKDDARAAGKADQGTDYCEEFGWYGDGECDDFCLQPDPDCGQGCEYDGKHYAPGESFPSSDGCNTCTCGEAGVGCTKRACAPCDPTLMCGQAITCVDGKSYPTTCGPANCDQPMGGCDDEPACDPTLMCGQAITCVDGKSYPTTCGPANCDPPMGDCEEEPACDPTLMCGDAITCIDGKLYPTTCGPANCDQPLGDC